MKYTIQSVKKLSIDKQEKAIIEFEKDENEIMKKNRSEYAYVCLVMKGGCLHTWGYCCGA